MWNNLGIFFHFYLKVLKRKYFSFQTLKWIISGCQSPAPQFVKMRLLSKHKIDGAHWLETGTYLGDTALTISRRTKSQYLTIEPDLDLYKFASARLRRKKNVLVLNGTSEEMFLKSLDKCGDRVNIWLDGHFSGDVTFEGDFETPIRFELECISSLNSHFSDICVFIDDVRCFTSPDPSPQGYPNLKSVIAWAEDSGFLWKIEQDIFIAKRIGINR